MKRLFTALGVCLGLGIGGQALAAGDPAVLSDADAQLYSQAFDAAEHGDGASADAALAQVRDPCLAGHVRYLSLAGPASHASTYPQLAAWLDAFKDLPGAGRVYALAMKMRPAGAHPTPPSTPLIAEAPGDAAPIPASRVSPAARQAYFSGDVTRARTAAGQEGDRWIAGLADYRLGRFADAVDDFSALTLDQSAGDDTRAAAAFWAARAADAGGRAGDAERFLRVAASAPDTFYGMIARRRLDLTSDPLAHLLDAEPKPAPAAQPISAGGLDAPGVRDLVHTDPRARRAIALMQIGRRLDAGLELRTGLAMASDDDERAAWTTLVLALNPDHAQVLAKTRIAPRSAGVVYPTPRLDPLGGFILNKALVYALTWQESRFDSLAVSHAGAIGLMQVMPRSVADITGDDSVLSDPIPLFDPATNLRDGQQYVLWLQQKAVGPDLLDAIAAYNGGPGEVAKAHAAVGVADDLLLMESLPYAETRDYVRKVMTAYWSYRRQFGADSPTLDAAASGSSTIDATLDR